MAKLDKIRKFSIKNFAADTPRMLNESFDAIKETIESFYSEDGQSVNINVTNLNAEDRVEANTVIARQFANKNGKILNIDEVMKNISDLGKIVADTSAMLEHKVDKVDGKDLSSNDFTDEYKDIVESVDPSVIDGKYTMPAGGIPVTDLSEPLQKSIESIEHISVDENGTSVEGDLNVLETLNAFAVEADDIHARDIYYTPEDEEEPHNIATEISELKSKDADIESEVSKKYELPEGGIPESNLSDDLQAKINHTHVVENGEGAKSIVTSNSDTHAYGLKSVAVGQTTVAGNPNKIITDPADAHRGDEDAGYAAFATGIMTVARGRAAFAEGENSEAIGAQSHAEGNHTKANGKVSHAEGSYTEANGEHSHAEGHETKANKRYSHAEGGNTTADGDYSHAEGKDTKTGKGASHAEGLGTETSNTAEHAEGKYNKSNVGTIHSIGIGSSATSRKNALEVMQNGGVYINGVGGYNGTNPSAANDVQYEIANIKEKAIAAKADAETANSVAMSKYAMPEGGIPESDLAQAIKDKLAKGDNIVNEQDYIIIKDNDGDSIIRINKNTRLVQVINKDGYALLNLFGATGKIVSDGDIISAGQEGNSLNAIARELPKKYTKPSTGIPESDLSQDVQDKLNSGGGDTSNCVHKTGDESISGNKTFTDGMTCGATFTPYVSVEYISIDDHHGNGDTFFWAGVTDYDIDGNVINAYDSFDHNLEPSLERVWIRPDDTSASVFYKYDEMDGWIPDPNFRDLYDVGSVSLDPPTVKIGGTVWSDVVGNALDALSIAKSRNPKLVAGSNVTLTNNADGTQTISATGGGESVNVVDSLDSESSTDALSARQGKVIGETITNLVEWLQATDEQLNSHSDAIQSNIESISDLNGNIGNPEELTTTAKTSLVAAVNEVNGKVADCSARIQGISRKNNATYISDGLLIADPEDDDATINVGSRIISLDDNIITLHDITQGIIPVMESDDTYGYSTIDGISVVALDASTKAQASAISSLSETMGYLAETLESKQDALTPGSGISIEDGVISATASSMILRFTASVDESDESGTMHLSHEAGYAASNLAAWQALTSAPVSSSVVVTVNCLEGQNPISASTYRRFNYTKYFNRRPRIYTFTCIDFDSIYKIELTEVAESSVTGTVSHKTI